MAQKLWCLQYMTFNSLLTLISHYIYIFSVFYPRFSGDLQRREHINYAISVIIFRAHISVCRNSNFNGLSYTHINAVAENKPKQLLRAWGCKSGCPVTYTVNTFPQRGGASEVLSSEGIILRSLAQDNNGKYFHNTLLFCT